MNLIVGGQAQGKYEYLQSLGYTASQIAQGASCDLNEFLEKKVLYQLHLYIKRLMEADIEPILFLKKRLNLEKIEYIVCDEVGCGIVPIEKDERMYRETVGRICIWLAQEAVVVERVYCGIPRRIKG